MIDTAIISKINEYGSGRQPFLLLLDFRLENCILKKPEEIDPDEILYDFNGIGNTSFLPTNSAFFSLPKSPVSFKEYMVTFEKVMKQLRYGNTYLLNLTFPTSVNPGMELKDILIRSKSKYRLYVKDHFVVFSPETFVKIDKQGTISSYPMKGTIDATLENAESRIMMDEKEIDEHSTIVDLIRNDMSMVAKKVRVKRFRYVERINTNDKPLLQVSSEICGNLPDDWNQRLGDIIIRLLPAGSVTGAPKQRTVEIICESETYERGFYTGIMGYFDGYTFDSAVMIRFIEKTSSGLVYKSGGGITVNSSPEAEYNEMIDKVYVPFV